MYDKQIKTGSDTVCMYLPKYFNGKSGANNVDPDQTNPIEQFYQGLHCLPFQWHIV